MKDPTVFPDRRQQIDRESTWDERMLGEELKILSELELGFDLETIGFEAPEIDLLIDGLNTVPDADPDDRVAEPAGAAVTVSGDLWQLGKHRVLCGTSLTQRATSGSCKVKAQISQSVIHPTMWKLMGMLRAMVQSDTVS